jgi:uroporphyrinogen decarboxylase
MATISHRQRLKFALNHQEPDRVPLDFGTGGNTSPTPEVYSRLAQIYKVQSPVQYVPHMMRLAQVDEIILQDLEIDTRPIYMNPVSERIRPCTEPGFFYDEWGVKWREFDLGGVIYREAAESPLQNASLEDLELYPWWPDPRDPQRYAGVQDAAQKLYETTDYALIGCPAFNSVWERAYLLCGYARMLEGLVGEPEFVHAVFRKITDIVLIQLRQFLELAGSTLEVVKIGDDLGGQQNCLMSPTTYRQTIKPYHQEIFTCIHQNSPAKAFLHTCGSVVKMLPDLVDAGVEILNPVQVSAKGMDTANLKRDFGSKLTFWGAVDTQWVLPHGTQEDVKVEVNHRIQDLGPGGGYVVAPVHNVQADVPAENVIAMYQAALEYGRYPL